MLNAYPHRTTRPESQEHLIRFEGAGSSAPVKHLGAGVTVTRTGAGVYRLQWSDNPGVFLGASYSLQAATMSGLIGHNVVFGAYDATNHRMDLTLDDGAGTPTAHDLAANEFITVRAVFSTSAVGGA
jgi:hypothetical protein